MSQIIERIKNTAKFKSSESTSSRKVQSWTVRDSRPCRNRMTNNYATGTFTGLIAFSAAFIAPLLYTPDTHATTASISVSLPTEISLNLNARSSSGTFATSDTSTTTFGIKTDNYTGYTLRIAAKTTDNNALINSTDSTKTIPSLTIANGVSESNYKDDTYASNNSLNNTWGYRPSKYNSSDNSSYLPAPTSTTPSVLDATTAANDTANNYNIAIGARIDNTITSGAYGNTFVLTVVANDPEYSITYNSNTTDTVTGMPSNISTTTITSGTVTISSNEPSRDGYTFEGWCTTSVADGGSCASPATQYAKGATYTIDQVSSNELSLYAMWKQSGVACNPSGTTITTIKCMQDITSDNKTSVYNSMTEATATNASTAQYQLYDSRDGKQYYVARMKDGHIWMTQNLDLEIGGESVAALTSENTDLTTSGSGVYSTDYSNNNGVITWTPASTNTTIAGSPATITNFTSGSPSNSVTGWTNNNNTPYMAEGGDHYVYTSNNADTSILDIIYDSVESCAKDHSAEDCAHYHVGNYYNWTAAIASSSSSDISTRYDIADNSICPAGWRLPKGLSSSTSSATTREFGELWRAAGITSSLTATSYATDGFVNARKEPLFFTRGGYVGGATLYSSASYGYWWSSSVASASYAYNAYISSFPSSANGYFNRLYGASVRCIVR